MVGTRESGLEIAQDGVDHLNVGDVPGLRPAITCGEPNVPLCSVTPYRAPRLTAYFVEPRLDRKVSTHILAISEPNPGHFWSISS
jgi:hypothetical protein